jgi:SAM-dependent methyltransferase
VAADTGGPILELACGSGRIAARLASATGVPVIGLDMDTAMLHAARGRGLKAAVQADMRHFAFRPAFRLVIVAYNSLQLLDQRGRADCLAAAATAVRPDGRLALECTDFQQGVETALVGPELLAAHDGLALYGSVEHDLAARTSVYRRRFEQGGIIHTDEVTIASLGEDDLRLALQRSGWRPRTVERDGARIRVVATLNGT